MKNLPSQNSHMRRVVNKLNHAICEPFGSMELLFENCGFNYMY